MVHDHMKDYQHTEQGRIQSRIEETKTILTYWCIGLSVFILGCILYAAFC